jgi:drug/metabolite transporter (DMT)-like permease
MAKSLHDAPCPDQDTKAAQKLRKSRARHALRRKVLYGLGLFFIGCVVFLWVMGSVFVQEVIEEIPCPTFVTLVATSTFSCYLIVYKVQQCCLGCARRRKEVLRARARAEASARSSLDALSAAAAEAEAGENGADDDDDEDEEEPEMSLGAHARAAMLLAPLWFGMNYLLNIALGITSVTSNTLLSTTSGLWVMVISILFFGAKVRLLPILAIFLTLGGVALVALNTPSTPAGDGKDPIPHSYVGDALSLCASVLSAGYSLAMENLLGETEQAVATPLVAPSTALATIGLEISIAPAPATPDPLTPALGAAASPASPGRAASPGRTRSAGDNVTNSSASAATDAEALVPGLGELHLSPHLLLGNNNSNNNGGNANGQSAFTNASAIHSNRSYAGSDAASTLPSATGSNSLSNGAGYGIIGGYGSVDSGSPSSSLSPRGGSPGSVRPAPAPASAAAAARQPLLSHAHVPPSFSSASLVSNMGSAVGAAAAVSDAHSFVPAAPPAAGAGGEDEDEEEDEDAYSKKGGNCCSRAISRLFQRAPGRVNMLLIFGLLGCFNLMIAAPLVVIFHFTGREVLVMPSRRAMMYVQLHLLTYSTL